MEVWLKEGDRNTSFFHKMANAHRRRNSMARVKINGTWLTEGNEIRDEVVNVFKVQLSTAGNWSPTLVAFPFARLEALEAARLEEPFFEEEVFEALKSFSGDKAPGPDGFSIAFWQFSWGQIPDVALVANETIDLILKSNECAVMCKLDIEKWCISTARLSVLINGTSSSFFQSSRGLRQRNPLSPYLFVIAMKALSCLLKRVVDGSFLTACKVRGRGGEGAQVSHLLFTNDTLVFYEASQDQMTIIRLRLDQIQRDFLWGGGALERKTHLVKWTTVFLDKRKGGLGVKCLFILNKALLYKWSWWFAIERWVFWNQVIKEKYGRSKGDDVPRKMRFWKDNWCGALPFCVYFPSLFALAVSKDAWVNDVWSSTNGGGSWSPHFSRPFNDWEVDEVDRFLLSLNRKSVQRDEDRVLWKETKCGKFSVKSLYKALEPSSTISFPSNIIWKSCV
ncbi:putative ribonuclease H protein [Vitis vinifera]|uniref:Putative ribonuclease H protein n=1 Tax=Vitis vinifera TaxID=29760 RepID=A0A438CC64_VITVI|nr:putative ribonuclease H protein [Vitis vinifera]